MCAEAAGHRVVALEAICWLKKRIHISMYQIRVFLDRSIKDLVGIA